ncbi:epimerase [Vibrio diabolicus]|uniref:epimerase n=1 Tax=Vibrio diabolicus TaxID=50719 RepID=UPI00373E78DF
MKILLTGGTGFIGSELLKLLSTHQVMLLTRSPEQAKQRLQHADLGNIEYLDSLESFADLNHIDAIINLAGEPIADKRWTSEQKEKICKSRWKITEQIVELIHASTEPPAVFISGSAVGYYGDQQDHPFDECLHVNSEDFPHEVCAKWEQIAKRAESEQTRVCLLRTGVVLGLNGGALAKMLLPNRIFSGTLAKTLKRPHILFTPKWAMELLMGESSCLLFDSMRAKPKKLTELGFKFSYSRIEPALKHLLHDRS